MQIKGKRRKTDPAPRPNLGAWLRCYASDEQTAVEALKRAQGAKEKPTAGRLSEKDKSRDCLSECRR